jgi:hypothetical protein
VVDGRERRDHNPAGAQLRLQLAQRDGGLGIDKGPEQILVRIQNRTTVAADPARRQTRSRAPAASASRPPTG